jgi:hypothetical protein
LRGTDVSFGPVKRIQRFERETLLAFLSGVLGVLTLVWPSWLEGIGWTPDHEEGAVEWMVAAAFLLLAVVLGFTPARRERN